MSFKLRKITIEDDVYLWGRRHSHREEDKKQYCIETVTVYLEGYKKSALHVFFDNRDALKFDWSVEEQEGLLVYSEQKELGVVEFKSINLNKPSSIRKIICYFRKNGWNPKENLEKYSVNGLSLIEEMGFTFEHN